MKCSKYAIEQFKTICKNEQDTPTDIIQQKLIRDFTLGTYIESRGEERFVMAYGTLRIEYCKGVLTDIWRSKKCYPVNQYAKYRWNYEHGLLKEEVA